MQIISLGHRRLGLTMVIADHGIGSIVSEWGLQHESVPILCRQTTLAEPLLLHYIRVFILKQFVSQTNFVNHVRLTLFLLPGIRACVHSYIICTLHWRSSFPEKAFDTRRHYPPSIILVFPPEKCLLRPPASAIVSQEQGLDGGRDWGGGGEGGGEALPEPQWHSPAVAPNAEAPPGGNPSILNHCFAKRIWLEARCGWHCHGSLRSAYGWRF